MLAPTDLHRMFGGIDIYLFDQIQRGRIKKGDRVLDVGCGEGRNIYYLLDAGYDVSAIDRNPEAIAEAMRLLARFNASLPPGNFRCESAESSSFPNDSFDVVISVAVLHFASSPSHFGAMLQGMWRVVRPGGMFFARLASTIGMESAMKPLGQGRFVSPDGAERYCVTQADLLSWTDKLSGQLLDPLKTTVVQDQRAMTTWVVRKN